MDLQTILANAVAAQRAEDMKDSPQLTLGETIIKIKAIPNLDLPVIFDFNQLFPEHVCSWRGSYAELAVVFGKTETTGHTLVAMLQSAVGKTYDGWKGGVYKMGRSTPVWVVGGEGDSGVELGEEYKTIGVIDIKEEDGKIVIITQPIDY